MDIINISGSTTFSLTSNDNNKQIYINCESNNVTVNLPPVKSGMSFDIVINNTAVGNDFTLNAKNSSFVTSQLIYSGQLGTTAFSTLTLDTSGVIYPSEMLFLRSNGSYWYLSLISKDISNYATS